MATICTTIDDDKAAQDFDRVLNEASLVAVDMIEVRTSICEGVIIKTVSHGMPLGFLRHSLRVGGESCE